MDIGLIEVRLSKDEGVRFKPYVDTTGNVTIGVGRNLTTMGITMSTVHQMLDEDIAIAIAECQKYDWFEGIDDTRKMLLVCLMFNLGAPRFAGFVAMISCLKTGNYIGAADELLNSIWAHEVGHRAQIYATIMRTGIWQAT